VVNLSAYQRFLDDCNVPDKASKYCTQRDCDIAFIQANRDPDGSLDTNIANPSRSLIRFEFLELVARIACNKYLAANRTVTLADAIDMFLADCVKGGKLFADWDSDDIMRTDEFRQ